MISSGLAQHATKLKFLVNENSTTILTVVGVVGTVTTAYLTGRASFKAAELIAEEKKKNSVLIPAEEKKDDLGNSVPVFERKDLELKEKILLVWPQYIPAATVCITTVVSIVVANKISSKKIAALTIASGISERALQEYKTKVVEKLGERQERNLRDELAQDRVTKNPQKPGQVVVIGTGKVLFYDQHTGRYFESTVEDVKKAINKINHDIIHFMSVSLSEFYDELGMPATTYTDSVGWNTDNMVDVSFSTTLSPDNQPCIAIDFNRAPTADYSNPYT